MMFLPSSFVFMFFMFMGVVISLSRRNFFLVWCGLEINLMGFIPIVIQQKGLGEIESSVKYFLVQSFGSSLLLLGISTVIFGMIEKRFVLSPSLIISGLIIKLGMFPFYFWLPGVMCNMSWSSCFLLATWQKVGPLGIVMFLNFSFSEVLLWLGSLGSVVRGLIGINQVNIKSLLAYSSIGHMGWILGISQLRVSIGLIYFGAYLLVNIFIFVLLTNINFSWFYSMKNSPYSMEVLVMVLGLGFLVLGGFPPFVGFFSKILGLNLFFERGFYVLGILFVFGSCFRLYYYINVVLNSCCSVFSLKGRFLSDDYSINVSFLILVFSVIFLRFVFFLYVFL